MSGRTEARGVALVATVVAGLTMAGCSTSPTSAGATATPTVSATATVAPQPVPGMVVPGYEMGQFPDVPLLSLPDLSLLYARDDVFFQRFSEVENTYPGLTLSPVACDASGDPTIPDKVTLAYGDGKTYAGPDGITQSFGDGSGLLLSSDETIKVNADGSGKYVGPAAIVEVSPDGSGQYTGSGGDAGLIVSLDGKGAGTYSGPEGVITNHGDGSGTFSGGGVAIVNNGDGSGSYTASGLMIENDGKGTAHILGTQTMDVVAPPMTPVPKLGKFPSLGALRPQKFCGVSITVDSTVLFDFGKADIRPEAQELISTVAQALKDNQVPAATIEGHTDSVGDDASNQTLSENRAGAVRDALLAAGVTTDLEAVGYGATRPVAPNTNPDGSDNPAGRQLNRRVEIYVPTFS